MQFVVVAVTHAVVIKSTYDFLYHQAEHSIRANVPSAVDFRSLLFLHSLKCAHFSFYIWIVFLSVAAAVAVVANSLC